MCDKYLKIFFFFLLTFSFGALQAQERIGLSVDRNDVLVGDLIQLKIEIQVPPNAVINYLDLKFAETQIQTAAAPNPSGMVPVPETNQYPDFDIRNMGNWEVLPDTGKVMSADLLKWDTLSSGTTTLLVNILELLPWDAGIIRFAPMELEFREGGSTRKISSNIIELKVNAVEALAITSTIDSLGLAPIKEIKREPFKFQDLFPYLLGLLLLCFLGLVIWSFLRKKQVVVPPPTPTRWIPLYELAIAQLQTLKEKQLWQKGEVKAYHSELTRSVRDYLENRYHIQALESPTSEILRQMQPLGFAEEHKMQLQNMLQMADMVKFAKASPDIEVHDRLLENAIDFIQKTKPAQLLDESAEGWVELPIDDNQERVGYHLVRDEKIRKRIIENAHDFLKFEEAPIGRRVLAALIDSLALSLIAIILGGILYQFSSIIPLNYYLPMALSYIALMLIISWIFFVEIEVRNGATPGKRLLSLQTMNAQQNNISRIEALFRWIVKILATTFFPLFIIYTLIKKSKILLQDQLTDTRVYYVKK